jgi:uncharacterized membrane protein YhaH (DUF805 family)
VVFASIRYNLARLFEFSGRESRALFWPYAIAVFLAGAVAGIILMVPVLMDMMNRIVAYLQKHPEGLPQPQPGQPAALPPELMPDFGVLLMPTAMLGLVSLFLWAAAVVRRLHDCDRSGWWGLLPVPFQLAGALVGPAAMRAMMDLGAAPSALTLLSALNSLAYWVAFIALVVILAGEGMPGSNRFGDAAAGP